MGIRSYLKERRLRGLEAFSGEKSLFLTSTISNGIWKRLEFDAEATPIEGSTLLALEGNKIVPSIVGGASIPYTIPRTIGESQTWDWSAISDPEIETIWTMNDNSFMTFNVTNDSGNNSCKIEFHPNSSRQEIVLKTSLNTFDSSGLTVFNDEVKCYLPLSMNNRKINDLLTPTAATQAANKSYVDSLPNFPYTIVRTVDSSQFWDWSAVPDLFIDCTWILNNASDRMTLSAEQETGDHQAAIALELNPNTAPAIGLLLSDGGTSKVVLSAGFDLISVYEKLDMSGKLIAGLAEGVASTDAVNKAQLDALMAAHIAAYH